MKKRAKHYVFLIAVKERRTATRIYAVCAATAGEALAVIYEAAAEDVAVELTGKLSGRLARSLKLKSGEYRFI